MPAAADAAISSPTEAKKASQTPEYPRRTGVIAIKVGMTQEWDQWGIRLPLTVLWIDDCQVTQVKTFASNGYNGLQLGCGSKRDKQVNGSLRGHFAAAGVPVKRKVFEFRVSQEGLLPVGTELRAPHFVAGQYVDIAGTTIGKGFQGVMKRFGFKGGSATHGNSKAHRKRGSSGAGCQDPGKVWKGTPMPGRMGGVRRTVQSVWVYKVDPERNLLYVKGQVPGHKGNHVYIKDAVYKATTDQPQLPWPTSAESASQLTFVSPDATDPFASA